MSKLTQADRYLLDQIRQGSAEGWSQLVDRYQGRLLAFARRKLRQQADAEDLTQETFISFLKALPNFREEAALETYLFTILRRKIINAFRGRKLNACLLQDVLTGAHDEDAADPAQQIPAPDPTASWYARRDEDRGQQKVVLAAALREIIDRYKKSLNFRDLTTVEMLFYCHLRNKDIGEIAGIGEKRVALIKHRCLNRIREHIAAGGIRFEADPPDALLSDIWQEQRLSCLKRSTIGAYLLGTLEAPWHDYIAFHLDRLGCRFCQANLEDLKAKTADDGQRNLRHRIMESTVGFLSKA